MTNSVRSEGNASSLVMFTWASVGAKGFRMPLRMSDFLFPCLVGVSRSVTLPSLFEDGYRVNQELLVNYDNLSQLVCGFLNASMKLHSSVNMILFGLAAFSSVGAGTTSPVRVSMITIAPSIVPLAESPHSDAMQLRMICPPNTGTQSGFAFRSPTVQRCVIVSLPSNMIFLPSYAIAFTRPICPVNFMQVPVLMLTMMTGPVAVTTAMRDPLMSAMAIVFDCDYPCPENTA
jgi:hypothetical protein